ncbi:MAG: DUF1343 domain-containing protein [Bacteroidales bacterium]|nr:DUF1343 domain-containing protein [Bacteroidales bacterium]
MNAQLIFRLFFSVASLLLSLNIFSQPQWINERSLQTGAQQTEAYSNLLDGKKVAIVANQSSLIGMTHLVDSLLHRKVNVVKIFTPEHGLTGKVDAGASVSSTVYSNTGIPVISLYGKKKQPAQADMSGIDLVVFDLQDVGVRFYTYISTLTYMMQACAEAGIPLIVLDRPNPNAFYVDGPLLEPAFRSFVGLHPVPVVYGLTIGEYAMMVNGEKWLEKGFECDLTVIPLKGYTHRMIVELAQNPSPNLKSWKAVYLYPSVCLFEGTVMSVGRGTEFPFEVYGHPELKELGFQFIPQKMSGASDPKFLGQKCYGERLSAFASNYATNPGRLHLDWLIRAYQLFGQKNLFFNTYFNLLAGTAQLRQQIEAGMSETAIRKSWEADLQTYKKIRAKYLLYPDE